MNKREEIETIKERIKHFWEKYRTIILIVLGAMLIIILPFITERMIRYGKYRPDSFENDVWFSFMGSYLGAVVTLLVMFITFKKTDRENKKLIEQQKKQHDIDMQNEKLARIIHVLLLDDYYLLNADTVCENINRFFKDLNSVQFDTLKFKYVTQKNEKLMDELLKLQMEEVKILNFMRDTAPHVDSEQNAREFKKVLLDAGLELNKAANSKREMIKMMYDDYLENVYQQYFE